jgi:hypothetical protein
MKKSFASIASLFLILCFLPFTSNTYPNNDLQFIPLSSDENMLTRQMQWEVWDNPEARDGPSQWDTMLTETSGIKNDANKCASLLLTGEKSWGNYSIRTNFIRFGDGSEEGISFGLVFGFQDPEHYYWAGYNSGEESFELVCRTPEGFDIMESTKTECPKYKNIPVQVDFTGQRMRFLVDKSILFDVSDSRYQRGQCGLAVSGLGMEKVLFSSISVQSSAPEDLPEIGLEDLLSLNKGARVVTPEDEIHLALIDHEKTIKKTDPKGLFLLSLKENELPYEVVFSFPTDRGEAEIQKIGIQLTDSWLPGSIEFLVSQESSEGFESIGTFEIDPDKKEYQEFAVKPTKAKYLKMKILTSGPSGMTPDLEKMIIESMGKQVAISEVYVYGRFLKTSGEAGKNQAEAPPSAQEISFTSNFKTENLDGWETWDDPEAEPQKSIWKPVLTEFSGISCQNTTEESATLLITEKDDWENFSASFQVMPTTQKGGYGRYFGLVFGYKNPQHYYRVGYNKRNDRYEISLFSPQGLELLSFAEMDIPEEKVGKPMDIELKSVGNRILYLIDSQVVFDIEDSRSKKGKVGLEASGISPLDSGSYLFSDIKVTPIDPNNPPEKTMQDLLSSRRGAAVIYRSSPPVYYEWKRMIDHSLDQEDYKEETFYFDFEDGDLPREAVFCFPQGRFAEIHKIGIQVGEEDFPKKIKFSVSNNTPKTGFDPLTEINIKERPESLQEFEVTPTTAKYLKIQITEAYSDEEIEIPEIFVSGYFKQSGEQMTAKEMMEESELREKESNNTIQEAQLLPLRKFLGGEVSKNNQDVYKIPLSDIKDEKLEISFRKFGIVNARAVLQTSEGEDISPSDIRTTGNTQVMIYSLKPGDYFLQITQPEIYVVLVYDDSGSMKVSVPTVKKVLRGYLTNLKEGLELKLMKYTDKVFMLSDFTRDPAQLTKAAESEVLGAGNTDTFNGLHTAIDEVKVKDGNRAVIAVLDELVCQEDDWKLAYIELWDAILDTGVIFSTIGVQPGWHSKSDYFDNTLNQIFSEIAYSTGGQFYHSPSDEMIEQSAKTIFEQFTSAIPYLVRAELKKPEKPKVEKKVKKQGSLQILFQEGEEKATINNVELIVDASNSMWGQIQGKSKISIAKEVLEQIINSLPEDMNVGLRLYGHRYSLRDSRACEDTELVMPMGPVQKKEMIDIIQSIKPKGKTPLVYSVLQATRDFQNTDKGTIVLISDGIESCGGDIHSIAAHIKEMGVDLNLHIIGFGIQEAEHRGQLESIARSTNGNYLDAKNANELFSSLEETLQVEFTVMDDKGETVGSGFVGGNPVELTEGSYTLRLMLAPEVIEQKITIKADQTLTFVLVKEENKWVLKESHQEAL